MATYVPPHKRHSCGKSLIPELQSPRSTNKPPRSTYSGIIFNDQECIYKWLCVGCGEFGQLPPGVHLQPFPYYDLERINGKEPEFLVNNNFRKDERTTSDHTLESPWSSVAKQVLDDLRISIENLRNKADVSKPALVARFGKILFLNSKKHKVMSRLKEEDLSSMKRIFYTNITPSYVDNVINEVIPKSGFEFVIEKDIYHVKLSDETRPGATVTCKCIATKDGAMKLYKVELNQVRHMTTDISCLEKDLDLRIMLSTKKILNDLAEDEEGMIREVISCGVVDPTVKGGIRWRMGRPGGGRFSVVGVWHISSKKFKSSSLGMKVRHADRYDNRRDIGEVTDEVTIKMKELLLDLQENAEDEFIPERLDHMFNFVWENLLSSPNV